MGWGLGCGGLPGVGHDQAENQPLNGIQGITGPLQIPKMLLNVLRRAQQAPIARGGGDGTRHQAQRQDSDDVNLPYHSTCKTPEPPGKLALHKT